jgi:hypothetical protein
MAKSHKKKAAARARASRWSKTESVDLTSVPDDVIEPPEELPAVDDTPQSLVNWDPIEILSESDTDCDYRGGVNCWSDSDDEGETGDDWSDSSDEESLVEFDGADLGELREELENLENPKPLLYDWIKGKKSTKEWNKAERNRGLGYTGNSVRTRQRNEQDARKRADFREEAKIS